MKSLFIKFILLFFTVNIYSQDLRHYKFDYYTLYDLKDETSKTVLKRYILGNSNDDSYFIYLNVTVTDSIDTMSLYDTKNEVQYEFNIIKKHLTSIATFADLTTSYSIYKFGFESRLEKRRVFDIEYDKNDNHEIITAKVFKNKTRKKLLSKIQYYMIDSDLTKNQFYIGEIVFAYKFPMRQITTKGVLEKQVEFNVTSDVAVETRKLVEMNPLNLELNLKTEPVITRTNLIIRYK